MNSLPDIEEVKDKSVNKGQQAMRIFRMLPVSGKSRGEEKRREEFRFRGLLYRFPREVHLTLQLKKTSACLFHR